MHGAEAQRFYRSTKMRLFRKKAAILLLILMAFCCRDLLAQAQNPFLPLDEASYTKNCLYVELLGQGILYSINYEHRFIEAVSGRIGYTKWTIPAFFFLIAGTVEMECFPVMINYLSGSGDHHFEIGLGAILGRIELSGEEIFFGSKIDGKETFALGTGTLGYRYQPVASGLLFKIGLTPIFNSKDAALSGGISLGYAF
jgi:hypothetical protein